MHSDERLDAIRREHGGSIDATAIRDAVRTVEASTPVWAVLSTVATLDFVPALMEAAEDRTPEEERAWLTLAAAGARKVRLCLAWQAASLLPPASVIEVLVNHAGDLRAECERRADASHDDEIQGPWLLLSCLWPRELRRLVKAHPRMSGRYRHALNERNARARRERAADRLHAAGASAAPVAA
jgi:hypothetical protein